MNHLLYHSGDRVLFVAPQYGVYRPLPAYVLKTVQTGVPFSCPHCGKRVKLHPENVQRYGYYLDCWYGVYGTDCCKPFIYTQLKRVHCPSEHPFKFINGAITHVE